MALNGYFRLDDKKIDRLAGYILPLDWWSRPYEYAWAIEFAQSGQDVADMGCGWTYRPFKDALAGICNLVYAVDSDPRLLQTNRIVENIRLVHVVSDFTQNIPIIGDGELDRVFCISVLEDLNSSIPAALREFKRVLKDVGLIVLTFDTPYNHDLPTPAYPGVNLDEFRRAVTLSGLEFVGDVDHDKTNLVKHEGWNLCCYHCVLKQSS